MATVLLNPDNGHVSGVVGRSNVYESWSAIRSGTGNYNNADPSSSQPVGWYCRGDANLFDGIYVFECFFDTSGISTGDVISSATLDLYIGGITDSVAEANIAKRRIVAVASSNSLTTALANSDFDGRGGTSFGSLNRSSISSGAYNSIALDANGLANIVKGGVTKFAVRIGADFDNTAPVWGSFDAQEYFIQQFAQAHPPRLTVVLSTVTRIFTETMAHTDAMQKQTGRALSESVTHTDAFSSSIVKVATFTETVAHTDAISRAVSRIFAEAVTHTDVLSKVISRVFIETSTFTSTIVHMVSRIFMETVTFIESFASRFSGWTNRTPPATSWTNRTPPATSWTDRTPPS